MGEPASKQRHICFVLANRRCVPQKLLEGVLDKASRMGAQTYKYNAFAPHYSGAEVVGGRGNTMADTRSKIITTSKGINIPKNVQLEETCRHT